MTAKRLFTAALVLGMLSAVVAAQSTDPWVGTWKLNAAKSKGAKSGTTTIESTGNGVKFAVDLVSEDGAASHWGFTANYDGKDYPVTGTSPYGDTVSVERVDAKTLRVTAKQDGKVTTISTIVVADDGKSRTTTTKGTDPKGQPVNVVSHYDKQ